MAVKKSDGKRAVSLELPEELMRRLEELAGQTGRTVTAEAVLALEFWLERQGMGDAAVETEEPRPPRRAMRPR